MDKDLTDVLFESLEALETHSERLDTLDKTSTEVKESINRLQSYLETKIEQATKEALKDILDKVNITNTVEPVINIDTDVLATEISKLINTKFTNSVNVEPAQIKVDIDTKAIADKLSAFDLSPAIVAISKQIEASSKESKILLAEMVKLNKIVPVTPKQKDIKSIKVVRDNDGFIESLEFIKT